MTWVIGASTIFGYGAVVSDVQVTFRNGTTIDMLQKAYPISNFIVAGFAGSVRIGFMLLQSLSDFLELPPGTEDTHAWDPIWVSTNWAPIAKNVFGRAPSEEKSLGSQLLLVGASPTESLGLASEAIFARFADPDFDPGIMTKAIKLCSIGSGSRISEYKRIIKPLFRLSSGILQAEVMNPGGWARTLSFSISRAINDHPRSGISRHLNLFHVRRGAIYEENNDERIYPRDGSPNEIRMPQLARGYPQFVEMARQINVSSAEAVC
ncbi:hypothetical protein [Sulfuricaulis sp.]|uniref:hypothetical protein n=1 Tax=Sulfuricaulis sp. TaxID=2003553 RepID=UPI003C76F7E5